MTNNLAKIIVILGPTASGKTDLAIKLAKKFGGEIISADSRQVYKEMDIATGKPPGEWQPYDGERVFLVKGVPHYLMDIINPDQGFSVANFKSQATQKIAEIIKRKKLPIIVGGTGLYIWAIVDNLDIAPAMSNAKLRAELETRPLGDLVAELKRAEPGSANIVDLKNKRRVVRAIELIKSGQNLSALRQRGEPLYDLLQIGIKFSQAEIYQRIDKRIDGQLKDGLVDEAKKVLKKYPISEPSMSGIGYPEILQYVNGEVTLEEAIKRVKNSTRHYAKRQRQWFKRDRRIQWIDGDDERAAEKLARKFLNL